MLADVPEYAWLKTVIDMFPTSSERKSEGIVVDLRKLRFRQLAMPTEWEHLVTVMICSSCFLSSPQPTCTTEWLRQIPKPDSR